MKLLFPIFLFFFFSTSAQKVTREILYAKDLRKIVLSSDEIYRIKISTGSGEKIRITTRTEGEYFNNISLESQVQNNTLFLTSRFNEILQNGYDKLSAHKVFSMEVELEIPREMEVEINSNLASVFLSGVFHSVLVQLKTGSCYFEDFEGDAVVNTFDGNILGTARSIDIEANSRQGKVEVPLAPHGNYKMVLTSINGDIKISETK